MAQAVSSLKPPAFLGAESPFHDGEQAVQQRVGVRARIEQTGRRLLRDFMPDEHREFFEHLPFVIAASADAQGGLWASLLLGEPGFVRAPDARRLAIRGRALPGDALTLNAKQGAALGLLGIELATRRRNRVNGRIARADPSGFELLVEQSFGNCKQYIQARAGRFVVTAEPPERESTQLSDAAAELLRRADTAFLATGSSRPEQGGREGLDASHRGGRPGFIRVRRDAAGTVLTLPDFSGNNLFNSFGNLAVNPNAGFLALDFDSGAVLSLSGTARVIWEAAQIAELAGAERLLELRPRAGYLWRGVLHDWSPSEPSPYLRDTGHWA